MSSASVHREEMYELALFVPSIYLSSVDAYLDLAVIPDSPHTIGVEFGTRIIEVMVKKIKLQIWDTGMVHFSFKNNREVTI